MAYGIALDDSMDMAGCIKNDSSIQPWNAKGVDGWNMDVSCQLGDSKEPNGHAEGVCEFMLSAAEVFFMQYFLVVLQLQTTMWYLFTAQCCDVLLR